MLLAIDTATNFAGIALLDGQARLRGAYQWHSGRNHTVELMPNVIRLLREAGARVEDLHAIAVAIGPGSYTGLRIGLSVAKGFCLARGAALVAVPTLDISAMAYPPREGSNLCALLQAGRGRLAAAFYRADSGEWQATGSPFFGRAGDLADACAGQPTFFAGEIDDVTAAVLSERLQSQAAFAPESEHVRDPRVLARLGWQRCRQGQSDNLETLAPVYGQ
jgi:tRNA threonylcarbamoyladenosine biosynthesis protein TsaB